MVHISLFELNSLIKKKLEEHLETSYWVIAEISELRENQKGHCYTELIEKEGNFIQAKIRANIWAYSYRTLKYKFLRSTGSELKSGLKILANVSINFHEVYGLSLTVNDIDPSFTVGEKSRQRQETIRKLQEDGFLDLNKDLELPKVPQRIAVISSETAAGYGDFMDQLKHNSYGFDFDITTFNSVMQGNEVFKSISNSLEKIRAQKDQFDLIAIIRGGGAQADLDSFDTYELAKIVAASPLPVFTGIGHERDETVVDLVAHTHLKTPTAVAEFIISGMNRFFSSLYDLNVRLDRAAREKISRAKDGVISLTHRLERASLHEVRNSGNQLETKIRQIDYSIQSRLMQERSKLKNLSDQVRLVDPKTIFERGYSLTLKNGRSIYKQEIELGDELTTKNEKNSIKSTVIQIEND